MAESAFKLNLVATVQARPDLMRWSDCGQAVYMNNAAIEANIDREKLVPISEREFKCRSMTSLKRELNAHGFQQIEYGALEGAMYHPWFKRDVIDLSKIIRNDKKSESHEKRLYSNSFQSIDDEPVSKKPRVVKAEVVQAIDILRLLDPVGHISDTDADVLDSIDFTKFDPESDAVVYSPDLLYVREQFRFSKDRCCPFWIDILPLACM